MSHVIVFRLVFGDCPQFANLSWMCRAASLKAVLHLISTAKRSCSTSFTPCQKDNIKYVRFKGLLTNKVLLDKGQNVCCKIASETDNGVWYVLKSLTKWLQLRIITAVPAGRDTQRQWGHPALEFGDFGAWNKHGTDTCSHGPLSSGPPGDKQSICRRISTDRDKTWYGHALGRDV